MLCPPTWRINTYTKAICSYALGWSVNTCVYACPPHFLSNCHAVGVLLVGDPVLYVIFCHFCTKYELICSFNTFCTCICPYYVQKTYKTTYEFHFQLGFSRRVQAVTSHGVSPHLAGRGSIHYIFQPFSESKTPICT